VLDCEHAEEQQINGEGLRHRDGRIGIDRFRNQKITAEADRVGKGRAIHDMAAEAVHGRNASEEAALQESANGCVARVS
jgi:hypothetical protein